MQDIEDLPSDSSDDDYDPGKDSNGEDEDVSDVAEDSDTEANSEVTEKKKGSGGSKKKRKKKQGAADVGTGLLPGKRRGGIRLEDAEVEEEKPNCDVAAESAGPDETQEDKEKLKADLLWADFNKDSNVKATPPRKVPTVSSPLIATVNTTSSLAKSAEKPKTIEITRIFDFAGEEIRVKAAVDANSKEAKQHAEAIKASPALERLQPAESSSLSPSPCGSTPNKQIGLSGVLNKLGLKKKISVLDKSKLDWNDFKDKEGIDDEIKTFNKGKDGYIEKQQFLQRADVRQFEVEKNLRMAKRNNR